MGDGCGDGLSHSCADEKMHMTNKWITIRYPLIETRKKVRYPLHDRDAVEIRYPLIETREQIRYPLHDRDAVEIHYPLIETREQIRYPLHDSDAEKLSSACDGGDGSTDRQVDGWIYELARMKMSERLLV